MSRKIFLSSFARLIALPALAMIAVAGCGQKGPLYLAQKPAPITSGTTTLTTSASPVAPPTPITEQPPK